MFKVQSSKFNLQGLKFFLFPVLFIMIFLNNFAQNHAVTDKVLVLDKIEMLSSTISFEYNEQGWVTSETREGAGNKFVFYKFEYEYDEHGNITLLTKYDPNIIHKEENEYNADNQIIVKNIYEDYGSGFKYVEQHLYTYENMQLQSILKQMISPNGPIYSTKQEFLYNKEQKLMQITKHDWVMGVWYHTETFDLEYNEAGNILYYALEQLQQENFAKIERYVFHYNEDSLLMERALHFALGEGWSPRPNQRYLYFYEPLLPNGETLLLPNIYQFDELNFNCFLSGTKIILDSLWIADCSGILHFTESANYSYKIITLNTKVGDYENSADILVYPNPTTGELKVESGEWRIGTPSKVEVEVFDIYGKRQSHVPHVTCNEINISDLPTGIYFVKITTEKQIITKKIIKY